MFCQQTPASQNKPILDDSIFVICPTFCHLLKDSGTLFFPCHATVISLDASGIQQYIFKQKTDYNTCALETLSILSKWECLALQEI